MKLRLSALLVMLLLTAQAEASLKSLAPFIEQHCIDCHGADKQKGDIRLDTLGDDLSQHTTLEVWQGVLDQLNLGDMPPAKRPQPQRAEVAPVVQLLTEELARAYAEVSSTEGQTVLRRLNRHELRNTLRDLLYLNGPDYDPAAAGSRLIDNNGNGAVQRTGKDPLRFFPEDEEEEGFFNIGDRLVMSDFLLRLTLDAVEEALDQATHLAPRPKVETRTFSGHLVEGRASGEHTVEAVSRELHPEYDMIAQGYERFGRLSPTALRGGVGVGARYRITVEVSAHNPMHPWPDEVPVDADDPFQLCLNIADTKNGGISGITSTLLDLWSVPSDGKQHQFSVETWMDPSWTPWIGWENGPMKREFRSEKMVEKYFPAAFVPRPDKKDDKEGHEQWPLEMARVLHRGGYPGPHLRVHRLTLEPLIETWPPQSHTALYGTGSGSETEIRQLLQRFAERAFRRAVTPEEVAPYLDLVLQQQIAPLVTLPGGVEDLQYRLYEGKWDKLPDFDALEPIAEGAVPKGLIDLRLAQRPDFYAMVFKGKITAPSAGEYLIEMASDDGGRISIDGEIVLEHDGLHGAAHYKQAVKLSAGAHDLRVDYLAYGAPNSFRAGWRGPAGPHVPFTVDALHKSNDQKKAPKDSLPPIIRAMQDGYAAILCSPQFLYLAEAPGLMDNFSIATRLSYFLWSSMPDETLFELARAGKLRDPEVRRAQVERMLDDPKAAAFGRHFTAAWLRLDKLGKMPPSGGDFQFYKNLKVEPLLLRQATLYFEDVLKRNGKIEQFIDSDYTFMNQVLAKWIYRREDIRGAQLRKVRLDDPRRGGIFTLPGVMTATANGVETSPVVRGSWVLENVLGTPAPPPPPDVEPLPTNTREATTIRELLALHRTHEACSSCHVKIDPMGFAFENFDVVGRWRDKYKRAKDPIDASATLANGKQIPDIVAYKQMLKERETLIVRSLASKMLTHATGRKLEAMDRGELDRITEELAKNENRLRDLVHLVVQSELFLNK